MGDQHGFYLRVEVVNPGSYADAFRMAIEQAETINGATGYECEILVTATGEERFRGVPNGVYCEGCEGCTLPGIRWPTATNGDESHSWIERCDGCQRYPDDFAARDRVIAEYRGVETVTIGEAVPDGCSGSHPFVDLP